MHATHMPLLLYITTNAPDCAQIGIITEDGNQFVIAGADQRHHARTVSGQRRIGMNHHTDGDRALAVGTPVTVVVIQYSHKITKAQPAHAVFADGRLIVAEDII